MSHSGIDSLLQQGKFADAEHASRAALQVCPTNAMLHAYLGICLFKQSQFAPAAESFKRANLLDPKFVDAGVKLAQCYDRLRRYEEAFEVAQEWLRICPSNRTLQGLVNCLELQVKGNRTDGWERSRNFQRTVRFAQDG
jgi:tetratricopeptide (TPR) repeat protein